MNFIDNSIKVALEKTLGSVTETVLEVKDVLMQSPAEFNPTVWSAMKSIAEVAVMPVAYTLLGLFFLIELWNITTKYNSSNDILPTEPYKLLFKVAIGKIILEKTFAILFAFFGIVQTIMDKAVLPVGGTLSPADIDSLMKTLEGMGNLEKVFVWIGMQPNGLMIGLIGIAVQILILGRMIEIYLYTAIAPIPLSTLINAEVNSIGKGFLKNYAAVVLQGLFMMIIVSVYGVLVEGLATQPDISAATGQVLLYSGVLLFALWSSGKYAKGVFQ